MSEPMITIPLALAQRLSDLLGGKWTYDSYGDCRYCGDPLSSEHRCELAQIERELDDLLSRAQPAPGAEALLSAAKIALDEMRHTIAPRDSFTDAVDALDAAIAAHSAGNAPHPSPADEAVRRDAERQMIKRCAALCDELDHDENTDDYRHAARWCAERIRMMGDDVDVAIDAAMRKESKQ